MLINSLMRCYLFTDDPVFTCNDGYTIPLQWQCDYESDCWDGEDEAYCDGCKFNQSIIYN